MFSIIPIDVMIHNVAVYSSELPFPGGHPSSKSVGINIKYYFCKTDRLVEEGSPNSMSTVLKDQGSYSAKFWDSHPATVHPGTAKAVNST